MIDTDSYATVEALVEAGTATGAEPADVLSEAQAAVWYVADQYGISRADIQTQAAEYLTERQRRDDQDIESGSRPA